MALATQTHTSLTLAVIEFLNSWCNCVSFPSADYSEGSGLPDMLEKASGWERDEVQYNNCSLRIPGKNSQFTRRVSSYSALLQISRSVPFCITLLIVRGVDNKTFHSAWWQI